jgi:hypothetical protein
MLDVFISVVMNTSVYTTTACIQCDGIRHDKYLHNVGMLSWTLWVLNDRKSYLCMVAKGHWIVGTAIRLQAGLFDVWIPTEKKILFSALNLWDRLWGPPSPLCNEYRVLFRSKAAGTEVNNSPLSRAEIKNEWSHTYTPPRTFPPIVGRMKLYLFYFTRGGARGDVVVKALCYKPAGRGFDSRWCHWNFSVT